MSAGSVDSAAREVETAKGVHRIALNTVAASVAERVVEPILGPFDFDASVKMALPLVSEFRMLRRSHFSKGIRHEARVRDRIRGKNSGSAG